MPTLLIDPFSSAGLRVRLIGWKPMELLFRVLAVELTTSLPTIRPVIEKKMGAATLGIDYVNRSRADRVSNVFTGEASQIVSRLGIPLTESLIFRAQNELNLDSSDPLYPNRTTFGLDWKAYPGVTLRLAHQFFDG